MKNPMNPMNRRPRPVIMTTRLYSSPVGFRAILRTRPKRPFPRRFARSSIRRWKSRLLSTISVMSAHHVDTRFSPSKRLARPVYLLRAHAREDQHHAEPVLQGGVDRGSPDDPGVGGDPSLDDLRDLLRLSDGHVRAAGDVHEGARRTGDLDIDQRAVDGLLDRFLRTPIALALAEADHRDASALHDRLHIVEVEVDEAGFRNHLGDPLDRPHQDVVRDLERGVECESRDELDELVVRNDDHRVGKVPELLEAELRVFRAHRALRVEGERADRDRERPHLLRDLCDDRGPTGAGSSAETAYNENQVGTLEG